MKSNGVKSWSYSRYRDYAQCPFKFKCKHVDGMKEPGSQAMERGSVIDKMAEDYVRGGIKNMPVELAQFRKQFLAVRSLFQRKGSPTVFLQESWCFTREWVAAKWNDWDTVWLRVKMDLCGIDKGANVLVPVDHKTGKYRENELGSYLDQLEIYSMAGMLQFPEVAGASPRLWFLDAGVEHPQDSPVGEIYYSRGQLPELQRKWEKKVVPLFTDTTFRPTPNDKCRFCHFRKENGGPCKF